MNYLVKCLSVGCLSIRDRVAYDNRNLLFMFFGDWKSEIRVPAWSGSSEGPLLDFRPCSGRGKWHKLDFHNIKLSDWFFFFFSPSLFLSVWQLCLNSRMLQRDLLSHLFIHIKWQIKYEISVTDSVSHI